MYIKRAKRSYPSNRFNCPLKAWIANYVGADSKGNGRRQHKCQYVSTDSLHHSTKEPRDSTFFVNCFEGRKKSPRTKL